MVCPCEVSPLGPMQARPDPRHCNVCLVFHVREGSSRGTRLAGLNAVVAIHTPGPMAQGNWTVAAYLDARASAAQQEEMSPVPLLGSWGVPASRFLRDCLRARRSYIPSTGV